MQETLEATKKMVDYLAKVNEILENNQNDPSRLIPILQQIQDVYKYLSKDVISYVATALDVHRGLERTCKIVAKVRHPRRTRPHGAEHRRTLGEAAYHAA